MIKNNYIKELTVTEEQAKRIFGVTDEMLEKKKECRNFGIPLPQWFINELYNILTINQYITDTDLNSFSYYFNGSQSAPPNLRRITWASTMDVLRTLLYEVFTPYINGKCIKLKDIDDLVPLIFISKKSVKLYNKSTYLTKKAETLKDFIEPLCTKLTSSYTIGYIKGAIKL